jgi:hypothetical protein
MPSRSTRAPFVRFIVLLALLTPSSEARGQVPETRDPATTIRLFIDCTNAPCDDAFFRTEISYVDHVRDRQQADVHLLMTAQRTAGGGREITFSFFGQGRFAGRDHVMTHTFPLVVADDQFRRGMVRVMSLGLVPYLLDTTASGRLAVSVLEPALAVDPARAHDPWDRWSLRVNLSATAAGERATTSSSIHSDFNANRTTDDVKMNVNVRLNYRNSHFQLPDGRTFRAPNRERGIDALYARSLLTGRWSAGLRAAWVSSTFTNEEWSSLAAPAIEWNLFPYAEATRRLLTLNYSAGLRAWKYRREIFGKLEEVQAVQMLETTLAARQRWGTVGATLEVASLVPDIDKHHMTLFGDLSFNVLGGVSLNLSTSVEAIRDQITLPRDEATAEEVLVNVRQLATTYRYVAFVGVSYTFGSIFSPIVNPRFGRGQ